MSVGPPIGPTLGSCPVSNWLKSPPWWRSGASRPADSLVSLPADGSGSSLISKPYRRVGRGMAISRVVLFLFFWNAILWAPVRSDLVILKLDRKVLSLSSPRELPPFVANIFVAPIAVEVGSRPPTAFCLFSHLLYRATILRVS